MMSQLTERSSRSVIMHRSILQWSKVRKQLVDVRFGHAKVQVRNHQFAATKSDAAAADADAASKPSRGQQPVLAGSFVHVMLPSAVYVTL